MTYQQKDLIILVADKDMASAVCGILSRHHALGIRDIRFEVQSHALHDPGCYGRAHDALRKVCRQYCHALVVFDAEGCGSKDPPQKLEAQVNERLRLNGWNDRAETIVLVPELEMWVWAASPHVAQCLGWQARSPDIRSWLIEEGFLQAEGVKPSKPKEAFRRALREVRKPISSAIFYDLATTVPLNKCTDPAFVKFRTVLQRWFPRT